MENDISLPEIILIDKPKGITSFDVIRILRKNLGIKKIGHAGTLDPLATGLLLVGVGSGTKKLHSLVGLPKTYRVEILFGKRTATGDMEGEILEQKEKFEIEDGALKVALQKLIGKLKIPVPIYSAIKKDGIPLYKKARKGEEVIPPVREMEIFEVRMLQQNKNKEEYVVTVEMDVASGVYVRSVVEELGRILDVPSTVKELRRTKIGDFNVKDAKILDFNREDFKCFRK